uniref:Uncharacterized protein n=1 Tax=Candidatus Kentrum sp. FW TaxID=2126338 RepID=A0A450TW53_9GAMM|nr:MAG: hypothetical protein BECKFW1821C_GA0114237_104715 [Candidatus Kentron sp. FW]
MLVSRWIALPRKMFVFKIRYNMMFFNQKMAFRSGTNYIARLIASGIGLSGKFTTAERERVRQRPVRLHSDYH